MTERRNPNQEFKGTPLFDVEYRKKRYKVETQLQLELALLSGVIWIILSDFEWEQNFQQPGESRSPFVIVTADFLLNFVFVLADFLLNFVTADFLLNFVTANLLLNFVTADFF